MRGRRSRGRLATGLGALAATLCLADEGRGHRHGGLREGSTRISAHAVVLAGAQHGVAGRRPGVGQDISTGGSLKP